MTPREFSDDDTGYLRWIASHPAGFVLNTERQPRAQYLKLHRTTCHTVSGRPARGNRWTAAYVKYCSVDRGELERWAREVTGGTPDPCRFCL